MRIEKYVRIISRLAAAIDPSAERSANTGQRLLLNCALWATGRLGPDAAVIISRRDGGTNVAVWSSFKPVRTSRLNRGRAEPLPDGPHKVFQIVAGSGSAAPSALLIFKRESAESRNCLNHRRYPLDSLVRAFFTAGRFRLSPRFPDGLGAALNRDRARRSPVLSHEVFQLVAKARELVPAALEVLFDLLQSAGQTHDRAVHAAFPAARAFESICNRNAEGFRDLNQHKQADISNTGLDKSKMRPRYIGDAGKLALTQVPVLTQPLNLSR